MEVTARRLIFVSICAAMFAVSCTKKSSTSSDSTAQLTAPSAEPSALVERGQKIYRLNCIACHNIDPKVDGSLGPAVSGSSLELLSARLIQGKYPEGYKAKRTTHTMPALPQLAPEIPALAAYLANP